MTVSAGPNRAAGAEELCAGGHCITCSDEAVAMRVLSVDSQRDLALCEGPDGAHSSVEIGIVELPAVGDQLLVHAGTAIGRVPS